AGAAVENPTPELINVFKITQLLSSIGGFVLSSYLFTVIFKINFKEHLGLGEKLNPKSWALVVALAIVILPAIGFIQELNSHISLAWLPEGASAFLQQMQKTNELITINFL